ncbi:MAG: ROK family transcriptional regulator [Ostreibacterium sp.]
MNKTTTGNRISQGTNQSDMRSYNEKLMLTLIRYQGPLTKAELTKKTGLSAQTASVITTGLESDGLLLKGQPIRGKVGQPGVPLSLNPQGAFFIGLNIGRRSTEIVLIDFLGVIKKQKRLSYPYPDANRIIHFTQKTVNHWHADSTLIKANRLHGMGISMPFELWKWHQLLGVKAEMMKHWKTCDIATEFAKLFPFPVFLQNDASAACGAELIFGQPDQAANFLYFYVGHFIGGGIVINHQLFTGSYGNAGALGSMPVTNKKGQSLQLIETSSISSLENFLLQKQLCTDMLWKRSQHWDVPETIFNHWIDDSATGLAQAILSAVSVIDFECVIIDGWFPDNYRQALVKATQMAIQKRQHTGIILPTIYPGTIGKDAKPLGAASLALAEKFIVS